MKKYLITTSHDAGIVHIETMAQNVEAAIHQVQKAEHCPDSSIKSVYEVNRAGFLVHATGDKVGDLVRVTPCLDDVQVTKAPRNPYASGYGEKIPTQYKTKGLKGQWLRVYVRCFSNAGTAWVKHPSGYRVVFDN